MGSWTIYSKNGVAKAVVKELELHDEWMAECYLTLTVRSATPVQFAVGDYLDYRSERYTIEYDPNQLKQATSGSYGEGFVYDRIKFVGSQDEVVRCDFNDIVLSDNNVHYTSLPTFPFYCESVDDLLDRIQANLEDLYPNGWIVIGLNTVRNYQRGYAVGRASAFEAAYRQWVDPDLTPRTDPYGKQGVAETADNITCWDALTKVHDDFDLNFIVRGKVIIVGTAGVFTANTFQYGKGNGLEDIEKIGDSSQRIITRLRAYGAETNLPAHYYSAINMLPYGNVVSTTSTGKFQIDVTFKQEYFVHAFVSGETDIVAKIGSTEYNAKASKNDDSGNIVIDLQTAVTVAAETKVYITDGVKRDMWPSDHKDYAQGALPDNMAVTRLMLPMFPNTSLYDWVKAHRDSGTGYDDATGLATYNGITAYFSKDAQRPYIDSLNKNQYGIRPASIYFDGSSDTIDIHPTIEGMEYDGHRVDLIYAAEQIQDNGVYDEGEVPNFTITLPVLGFNLADVYEEGASIDLKDGMCGGRSFKMAAKPTQDAGGRWVCVCERSRDENLNLYFPYNDFQIAANDHYVLTGIQMPDAYIEAAAVKLLGAALDALQKNEAPRFTYQPKIDKIFMQKQHDYATASQGVASLHDTLKAGDVFQFADTDMGIDASIIIDVLTIKENGDNGLPTYEVALRDEKQISTIQKIQNKVDSVISGAISVNGSGSNLTPQQIRSIVNSYGSTLFLSKLNDDTAAGFIRMLRGLQVGDQFVSGLLGEGAVFRKEADGTTYVEADKLYIRMKAYFDTVVIREYRHEVGNRVASVAGAKCVRVAWYNSSNVELEQTAANLSSVAYFRCFFRASDGQDTVRNDFIVGDQVYCHITSVETSSDNPEQKGLNTKHYWRLCIGRNVEGTLTANGEAWIDISNRSSETLTIGGTSYTHAGYQTGSDVPAPQDSMIQLGCIHDTDRQGAIIEYVTGANAPAYQIYQGINDFSLNGKSNIIIGYNSQTGHAEMKVYGDAYIGDPNGTTYIEYKQDDGTQQHNPVLNIKARINASSTIGNLSLPDYIKANQKTYDAAIADLVTTTEDLQSQIDGAIDTWYFDYMPVAESQGAPVDRVPLTNVEPYKTWYQADNGGTSEETRTERTKHLGDIFYDNSTGYAFRFSLNENTSAFEWVVITDSAVIEALERASHAQETADGKMSIYSVWNAWMKDNVNTLKMGDLFIPTQDTTPTGSSTTYYKDKVYKCLADGTSSFREIDYTDDSALIDFVTNTYATDLQNLNTQIDKKAETWYQDSDPSSVWTTDALKAEHVGDIWCDTSANGGKKTWIFRDRGAGQQNRYYWAEQAVPDVVFDDIDGKCAIYVAWNAWVVDNVSKLQLKDLFIPSSDTTQGGVTYKADKVYRCTNATTPAFKEIDYTDDAALTNFINNTYSPFVTQIQTQVDQKAETWYQSTDPSSAWTTAALRTEHIGDIWHNTSPSTVAGVESGRDAIWNGTSWGMSDVPQSVYDKIDGKADIFVSKPSTYNEFDLWIIESGLSSSDMPTGCVAGDIVIADNMPSGTTKRTSSYTKGDWRKKDRYTDDSAFNGYINAILNGSGASGDSATAAAAQRAIIGALGGATVVDGGLMLTSLIGMRKYKGTGSVTDIANYDTWAGISGEYDANLTGGGIAAWYGGGMKDYETLTDAQKANGWSVERWAKSLLRFDGSGYLANDNIRWNANGIVTIANVYADVNGTNVLLSSSLQDIANLSNAFPLTIISGVTYLDPQYGFSNLSVLGNSVITTAGGTITGTLVLSKTTDAETGSYTSPALVVGGTSTQAHLEIDSNELIAKSGASTYTNLYLNDVVYVSTDSLVVPAGKKLQIGDAVISWDATNQGIKITKGLYSETFISALGAGTDQGGGGDVTWALLADNTDTRQIAMSHLTNVLSTLTGYTASGKYYAVQKDSSNHLYVYVPWESGGGGTGTVTSIKLGSSGTTYTPTNGLITLPAYPTVPTAVSAFTNDSGYITSSGSCAYATSAGSTILVSVDNSIVYGRGGLQFQQEDGNVGTSPTVLQNPSNDWYSHIVMNHANGNGYYIDLAFCFHHDDYRFRRVVAGVSTDWGSFITSSNIGAQSVSYATSAGNADTVDNLHGYDFVRGFQVSSTQTTPDWARETAVNYPRSLVYNSSGQEWGYLNCMNTNGYYGAILKFGYNDGNPAAYLMGNFAGTWSDWIPIMTSLNIGSQSVSYATSAGTSSCVSINYNNDTNYTFQMLWGSGNYVYGTGGIYCNPYSDVIYSGGFYHNSYGSSAYALTSDGGAAHIPSMSVNYANSAGNGIFTDDNTLGNNVNFNSITYALASRLTIEPIHVPNYSGQLNAPFNGYGTLITFNDGNTLFPFQIAHDNGSALYYRDGGYKTTDFTISTPWRQIAIFDSSGNLYVSGNLGVGTSANYKLHVDGTFYASGNSSVGGTLTLKENAYNYVSDATSYALNCRNSDIINVNGIYTADVSNEYYEGINFKRSDNKWDSLNTNGNGDFHIYKDNGSAWAGLNCGMIWIYGPTTATMTTATTNPRVVFAERTNGTNKQRVGIVYTDYDAYRAGKGLKVMDMDGEDPNVWFEVAGNFLATGAVTALSDIRHKDIIKDVDVSVEQIARMPAVVYKWNDRKDKDMHVGSIAQDWQRILPEVVMRDGNKEGTLSMQYGVAALVSSIITARKVVDHERRIAELERENKRLKEMLNVA